MTSAQHSDNFFDNNVTSRLPTFNTPIGKDVHNNSSHAGVRTDSEAFTNTTLLTEDMLTENNSKAQSYAPGNAVMVRMNGYGQQANKYVKARFEGTTAAGDAKCYVYQMDQTQVFDFKNVIPDNTDGLIKHKGYYFRQVFIDTQKECVVIRNLNRKPFGRSKMSPSLLTVPIKEVEVMTVNLTPPPSEGNQTLGGGGALPPAAPYDNNSIAYTLDSELPLDDTARLLEWGANNIDHLSKGALVLVQTKGDRWNPARLVRTLDSGDVVCELYESNFKQTFPPDRVRLHDVKKKDIAYHKGYLFRLVDVQNTEDMLYGPLYTVRNLNKKPFGLSSDSPTLFTLPACEIQF